MISWAETAWAEVQAGGGKTGFRRRAGDSPFTRARFWYLAPAKSLPKIHSWIDTRSVLGYARASPGPPLRRGEIQRPGFHQLRQTGKVMTEQNTGADAPSTTSSSDSIIAAAKASQAASSETASQAPPGRTTTAGEMSAADSSSEQTSQASSLGTSPAPASPKVIATWPAELAAVYSRLEAIEDTLHEHFGPKLEALEEGLESLANRAASESSPALAASLNELRAVVQSLGGTQFGHRGHDGGNVFHAWWKKITGATDATQPSVLAQAGGSVVNSPSVPAVLANQGAPIPLGR